MTERHENERAQEPTHDPFDLLCVNCHRQVAEYVALYRHAVAPRSCEPCKEDAAQYPLPFDAHAEDAR